MPLIRASIEKLGFKFSDVKILLISHAHWDHDAGSASIKQLTGARYMVMDADVPVVESGGKADFQYGSTPASLYPPTKVDRVLHDGDEVRLGGAVLVAHLTPGHTKGCTTWTMKVQEDGKTYNVVIVGSPNVNPGYKLVSNTLYPRIAAGLRADVPDAQITAVRLLSWRARQLLRHGGQVRRHEDRRPEPVHRSRGLQEVRQRTGAGVPDGARQAEGRTLGQCTREMTQERPARERACRGV